MGLYYNNYVRHKIIILDDDELLCEEIAKILEAEGYAADYFCDPRAGLKQLMSGAYDLLLLDLKLPGFDGDKILKLIRESRLAIKTIMISGSIITEQGRGAFRNLPGIISASELDQADAVLAKPFDPEVLLREIGRLIGQTPKTPAPSS